MINVKFWISMPMSHNCEGETLCVPFSLVLEIEQVASTPFSLVLEIEQVASTPTGGS